MNDNGCWFFYVWISKLLRTNFHLDEKMTENKIYNDISLL